MDLILGPFADAEAANLSESDLSKLERLLDENDQDIYAWISRRTATPEHFGSVLGRICRFHDIW